MRVCRGMAATLRMWPARVCFSGTGLCRVLEVRNCIGRGAKKQEGEKKQRQATGAQWQQGMAGSVAGWMRVAVRSRAGCFIPRAAHAGFSLPSMAGLSCRSARIKASASGIMKRCLRAHAWSLAAAAGHPLASRAEEQPLCLACHISRPQRQLPRRKPCRVSLVAPLHPPYYSRLPSIPHSAHLHVV
jgi:hypothetical protein